MWNLVRWDVIPSWPSKRYDLIHSNCIHFCDDFLLRLGVKPVPAWVRGLHETGAALFRTPWPLSWLVGRSDAESVALLPLADDEFKDPETDGEAHEHGKATPSGSPHFLGDAGGLSATLTHRPCTCCS